MIDQLRGVDSVGVLTVDNNGGCAVAKSLETPASFLKSQQAINTQIGQMRVLMGHNRWKTKGAISVANAHPFRFQTVIGAHNGTLRNQALLPDSELFDVDSENIYHSFDTIGVQETVPLLNGAYALTWYDKVDKSMNFLRNSERPLFFCSSADEKTLFWASEAWMLNGILARHNIAHTKVLSLDVHKHLKVGIGVGFGLNVKPLGAVEVTETTPFRLSLIEPVGGSSKKTSSPEKAATDLGRREKRKAWKEIKKQARANKSDGKKTDPTIYSSKGQNSGTTTSHSKASQNNSLVGKTVQFTVDVLETFSRGADIKLVGRLSKGGDSQVICWLIGGRDDILIDLLSVDDNEFTATVVTNYPHTGNGIINIDPKTISLVKAKPHIKVKSDGTASRAMGKTFFTLGFNDEHLSREEFYKLITADGCACCTNKVVPNWNADKCEWISPIDFFCPACVSSKDEETHEYMRQLRSQFNQTNQHKAK